MKTFIFLLFPFLLYGLSANSQPLIFILQGTITNVNTKRPVPGTKITITDGDSNQIKLVTDENGFWQTFIQPETDYHIWVCKEGDHPGYLCARGTESTKGVQRPTTFVHDFALQPFSCGPAVTTRIQFAAHSTQPLNPDSGHLEETWEEVLEAWVNILLEFPHLVIRLDGHSGFFEDQGWSELRSQKVKDLMVADGIDPRRIEILGFGWERPLVTKDYMGQLTTEEIKDADGHNRRVVITVIRDDFQP